MMEQDRCGAQAMVALEMEEFEELPRSRGIGATIEAAEAVAKLLLQRFKGYGAHIEAAAQADVYEAKALVSFFNRCELYSWGVMSERRLFTLLVILRIAVDDSIPAPDPLRSFAHFLFHCPASIGVDEDADCWEPLQELWCTFNKGKVCARNSNLHLKGVVKFPLRPLRTPPPFVFEAGPRNPPRVRGLGPPGWKPNPDCSCKMPDSGDNASCWNLFDLVDRLALGKHFMVCPVQNLGWNLREAVMKLEQPEEHLRVIDEAYSSKLSLLRPPNYAGNYMWCPPTTTLRVGEVKLLIQGLHYSLFLWNLLLSTPPLSTLPLHYLLSEAALHARLWLLRCDLPVYYNGTLTYADIGTRREFELPDAQEADEIRMSERGPSKLEHLLRHETLFCYGTRELPPSARVRNLRPHEYKIPEEILKKNEKMWKALTRLAHPQLVFPEHDDGPAPPPVDPVKQLAHIYPKELEHETREKKNWLLSDGEPESYDPGYPRQRYSRPITPQEPRPTKPLALISNIPVSNPFCQLPPSGAPAVLPGWEPASAPPEPPGTLLSSAWQPAARSVSFPSVPPGWEPASPPPPLALGLF